MIVDDDPFNRFTIGKLLERLGIPTSSASNGSEAIELIKENAEEYGMILMDVNMAILNGIQVITNL